MSDTDPIPTFREDPKVTELLAIASHLDPNFRELNSPLNHPIRNRNWMTDPDLMEIVSRHPTWGDAGLMVAVGQADNREYGLTVNRLQDRTISLEFFRGGTDTVRNGGKSIRENDAVFFHTHPSINPTRESHSPLVSGGDIDALKMGDWGGGFLNVFSSLGATFHIGCETASTTSDFRYKIETGEFAGQTIKSWVYKPEDPDLQKIMLDLKTSDAPYVYSIQDPEVDILYSFIHIPWSHFDSNLDMTDVCFGNGLSKMMGKFNLPAEFTKFDNLHAALTDTTSRLDQGLDRSKI